MLDKKWILVAVGAAVSLAWAVALWASESAAREQVFEQIRVAVGRGILGYFTVYLIFETFRLFASRSSTRLSLTGVAWRVALAMLAGFLLRNIFIEVLRDSDLVVAMPNASILATVWAVLVAAPWTLLRTEDQPNPWTQRVEGRTLVWILAGFTGFVVFVLAGDEWVISSFLWRLVEKDFIVVIIALLLAMDRLQKHQAFLLRSRVSPDSLPPEQGVAMSGAGS